MGEEQVRVDPNEDLESLIARLKQSRSKDVVLVLPSKTRALQTLDNFYALRKAARDDGLNLTFEGGSKTVKGLAKLLGFRVNGGDSDDDSTFADFAGDSTEQITMPPAQMPQRTAVFEAPPSGFVVQQPGQPQNNAAPSAMPRNGANRGESMPPPPAQPRSPQDFFNDIPDMSIPSIQPPPMRNNGGPGMDFNNNDAVLNRNNVANFFDDMPATPPPAPARPPIAPEPGFDFAGGASTEGRTMTYEEAMRTGIFNSNEAPNLSSGFQFNPQAEPPMGDEDDVPAVPQISGDTAADRFRRPGVRRDDELDDVPGPRGRPSRGNRQPKPARNRGQGVGMPPAIAGLGTRVNKILNPVERTSGGGMGMRSELSPEEKDRRRRQSSRTTFLAFLIIGILVVAVALIILLSLLNSNNGNGGSPIIGGGPVANTRLNVIYKTNPVNSNVNLLLDTSNTGGVSGTASNNPGNQPGGTSTGGRLPVTQITATPFTAKADYPAFGSRLQPTSTAQGTINFSNGAAQPFGYGAGTVIYTNRATGVTYRLRDAVSIPAGNPFGGGTGKASGVIVADKAGSVGNLPNGFSFYLNNGAVGAQAGPIAGGAEQPVKVVSKEDQDALRKQLVAQAQNDAQNSLKDKYNPATQDIQIIPNGDPSCQFTKNPGDVSDTFSGSCTINPQAYIYNKSDMQRAVQDQMVSDPKLKVDPTSIKITNAGQIASENGRLRLPVTASALTYSPIDLDKFKSEVAGKTIAEVQQVINTNYPQIDRIDVSNVRGDKMPEASKIDLTTTPGDAATTPATGGPASGTITAGVGTVTPGATNPTTTTSPAPTGTPGA